MVRGAPRYLDRWPPRRARGRVSPPRPPEGPPAPPGTRAAYARRSYGWPFHRPPPEEWAGERRAERHGRRPERWLARPGYGGEYHADRRSRRAGYGGEYDRRDRGLSRRTGDRAWYARRTPGRYPPPPDRPWRSAYDAASPEDGRERRRIIDRRRGRERRSGIDRRTGEMQGPGWLQRGRKLLQRFREPIIGLTVAAAAAPLARQAGEAPEKAPAPRRAVEPAAAAPRADIEEEIGRRLATAAARGVRTDTIEGAVLRYGIDRDLAADIYDAAVDEGIEPDVAFGLVNTESAFKPRAVSSVGARGLTQLMPATARWLDPGLSNEDIFDRRTNLRLGFHYLDRLIGRYDGNLRLALLAYNRGPGTVDRVLDRGGDPDNGYADMVLSG